MDGGVEVGTLTKVEVGPVGPEPKAVNVVVAYDDSGVYDGTTYRGEAGDVGAGTEVGNECVEGLYFRYVAEVVLYVYAASATVRAEGGGEVFLVVGRRWVLEGDVLLVEASVATDADVIGRAWGEAVKPIGAWCFEVMDGGGGDVKCQ